MKATCTNCSKMGHTFKSFLTGSQDLKVNLCGLQQDKHSDGNGKNNMMMWELPGNSHTIAIQWVHMVKDPPATILLVHTVTSKYTFLLSIMIGI